MTIEMQSLEQYEVGDVVRIDGETQNVIILSSETKVTSRGNYSLPESVVLIAAHDEDGADMDRRRRVTIDAEIGLRTVDAEFIYNEAGIPRPPALFDKDAYLNRAKGQAA